jgi:hypothetical protein
MDGGRLCRGESRSSARVGVVRVPAAGTDLFWQGWATPHGSLPPRPCWTLLFSWIASQSSESLNMPGPALLAMDALPEVQLRRLATPLPEVEERRLVIAIDYGTTYTGTI